MDVIDSSGTMGDSGGGAPLYSRFVLIGSRSIGGSAPVAFGDSPGIFSSQRRTVMGGISEVFRDQFGGKRAWVDLQFDQGRGLGGKRLGHRVRELGVFGHR